MLKICQVYRSKKYWRKNLIRHQHRCTSEGESKGFQAPERNVGRPIIQLLMEVEARRAATYLVDCLLTLLVLLRLLLHLLPLLDVVDEREKVTQVDDERLCLDEDRVKQVEDVGEASTSGRSLSL